MRVSLPNKGIDTIEDLCGASADDRRTLARVTELDLTGNKIVSCLRHFDTGGGVAASARRGKSGSSSQLLTKSMSRNQYDESNTTTDPHSATASVFSPLESLQTIILANNLLTPDLRGMGAAHRTLTHIDVRGNKLTSLDGLQECTRLVYLNVSGNALSSLDGLPHLDGNRRGNGGGNDHLILDASHNVIKSKAVRGLRKTVGLGLGGINLSHNVVELLDPITEYLCSPRYFPQLTSLDISFNPCLINGSCTALTGGRGMSIIDALHAASPHLSTIVATHHGSNNSTTGQQQHRSRTRSSSKTEDISLSSTQQQHDETTASAISALNDRYSSVPPVAVLPPHHHHQTGTVASAAASSFTGAPTPANSSGGGGPLNVSEIAQWPSHANTSSIILPARHNASSVVGGGGGSSQRSCSGGSSVGAGGRQQREESILDPYKPRRMLQRSTSKRSSISNTSMTAAGGGGGVEPAARGAASETPSNIEDRIGGDSLRSAQDQLAVERQLGLHHMSEIKRLKKELAQKSRLLSENVETVRQQRGDISRLNERVESLTLQLRRKTVEVDGARQRADMAEVRLGALQTRLEVTASSYEGNGISHHHYHQGGGSVTSHKGGSSNSSSMGLRVAGRGGGGGGLGGSSVAGTATYPPHPHHRSALATISPNTARNKSHVDNFGVRHSPRKAHVRRPGDIPFAHKSYVYPEDEIIEQVGTTVVLKHNIDHLNVGDEERQIVANNIAYGRGEMVVPTMGIVKGGGGGVYTASGSSHHHQHRSTSAPRTALPHHQQSNTQHQQQQRVVQQRQSSVASSSPSPLRRRSTSNPNGGGGPYPSVQFKEEGNVGRRVDESDSGSTSKLTRANLSSMGGDGKEVALEGLCEAQASYIDEVCEENAKLISMLEKKAAELSQHQHQGSSRGGHHHPHQHHYDPNSHHHHQPSRRHHYDGGDENIESPPHDQQYLPHQGLDISQVSEEDLYRKQHQQQRHTSPTGITRAGPDQTTPHSALKMYNGRGRGESGREEEEEGSYHHQQHHGNNNTPLSPPKLRAGTVEPSATRAPSSPGRWSSEERTPPRKTSTSATRQYYSTPPHHHPLHSSHGSYYDSSQHHTPQQSEEGFHYSTNSIAAAVSYGSTAMMVPTTGGGAGAAPPSKAASPLTDPLCSSSAALGGGGRRGLVADRHHHGHHHGRGPSSFVSTAPGIHLSRGGSPDTHHQHHHHVASTNNNNNNNSSPTSSDEDLLPLTELAKRHNSRSPLSTSPNRYYNNTVNQGGGGGRSGGGSGAPPQAVPLSYDI